MTMINDSRRTWTDADLMAELDRFREARDHSSYAVDTVNSSASRDQRNISGGHGMGRLVRRW